MVRVGIRVQYAYEGPHIDRSTRECLLTLVLQRDVYLGADDVVSLL